MLLTETSIIRKDVIRAVAKMEKNGTNVKKLIYWFNKVLNRYLACYSGGLSFGWDWSTMRVQANEVYQLLKWFHCQALGFIPCENGAGI